MTPPVRIYRKPRAFRFLTALVLVAVLLSAAGCGAQPGSQTTLDAAPAAAAPANQLAAPTATEVPTATPEPTATPIPADTPTPDPRPMLNRTKNILLLGSDRRPDMPNWRTDVMMIVAIDEANQRVGVISLPRDIYIDVIPNHNANKINVVDYLGEQDEPDGGGPKLLGSILEQKIGVPIHHYVRFDFETVKELVDAMGGVEVQVDCPLYDPNEYDEGGLPLALEPGIHRLNGGEALSFVRSRRIGGDLERERRQQRFVWAVRNQIRNENLLPRIPALYTALADSIQTDINLIDAVGLVRFALDLNSDDVHGFVVNDPALIKEGYAGQMWVWYPNWDKIAAAAQQVFDTPPLLESEGEVKCP